MQNTKGKRIAQLIFAKGFKSVRSFAIDMKEKYPEDYVSEDTISNVIKGINMRESTLVSIAKALEVPIEFLISENTEMDDYLNYEIQPLINEYCEMENIKDSIWYDEQGLEEDIYEWFEGISYNSKFDMRGNFQTAKDKFDISNWFYPMSISEPINSRPTYHIRTLGDVAVYLPLCNILVLTDVLFRIGGEVECREKYILSQFNYLYRKIPNIPAKRYADYCVVSLRLDKKTTLSTEELRLRETLAEYRESKEFEEGCKQYYDILQKYYDLCRDFSIKHILEKRLPEIYGMEKCRLVRK